MSICGLPLLGGLGMRLIADSNLDSGLRRVQFRFPRTKRRRTRKKWAKRPENWKSVRVKSPDLYRMQLQGETVLVGHPLAIEAVRASLTGGVNEEITRQALQGVTVTKFQGSDVSLWWDLVDHLAAVIARVRLEERKACSDCADHVLNETAGLLGPEAERKHSGARPGESANLAALAIGKAIRARSEP